MVITARNMQPCIGVFAAGDNLTPMARGRSGSWGSLVTFVAWPNSVTTFFFTYWSGSEFLQNLQLLINLGGE